MHHLEAPSGEVFLALLQGWAGEDYGESSGDLELLPGTWSSCPEPGGAAPGARFPVVCLLGAEPVNQG